VAINKKNGLFLISDPLVLLEDKSKRASLCRYGVQPFFLSSESYYLYAKSCVHKCVTYFLIILLAAGNKTNRYYRLADH
jgi:hypothetical protein